MGGGRAGWWRATREILRRLVDVTVRGAVDAVGVTGQAPTLVAVDAAGWPVRPAILWLDVRSEEEAQEAAARLGEDAERIGGNRLHAYYLGPKLAWLRRHEPDRYAAAATVLQSHSFSLLRLTGARMTDYSSAALCAPLYAPPARAWSPDVSQAGRRAPPCLTSARSRGGRARDRGGRAETGRRGHAGGRGSADFAASTLAAGVTDQRACLMLGTAGNLIMPFTEGPFDTRLINAHHVGCDRYLALGATLAGAVQQWFRDAMAPGVAFEALDREAAAIPAGAEGVRCLPYLQGERTPVWDAGARGAYVGLSLAHGRGHLYRAVLEGIAVSFRHCLEVARESGLELREVIAVNGGARSALWRQILCDALGEPLSYLPESPGAPAGAAILAGIGAGVLPGVETAKAWRGATVCHVPEAASTAVYAGLLAERIKLYPALRAIAAEP